MNNDSRHSRTVRGVVASLAVVVALTPRDAAAIYTCDACVVGAVSTTTTAVAAAGTAITTALAGIVLQIQLLGMGIKGTSDATQQVIVSAAKNQTDALVQSATAQKVITEADRFGNTDPCAVSAPTRNATEVFAAPIAAVMDFGVNATGAGTMARARTGLATRTPIRVGSGGKVDGGGGKAQLKEVRAIQERTAPSPDPSITLAMGASAACSEFAVAGTHRYNNCTQAGLGTNAGNRYGNADVRAQTIFDGPQASSPKRTLTVVMTPDSDEDRAIKAFARNLSSPVPLKTLAPAEASSPNGRIYLGLRDIYDARMSLAEYPVAKQVADLTATQLTLPQLKEMVGATDAFARSYLSNNVPGWLNTGVSPTELMNIDVERRYANINWVASLEKMSVEKVAREQARIAAQHSVLLWKSVQEQRLTNVLLGAILASKVRSESEPELKQAHQAALR